MKKVFSKVFILLVVLGLLVACGTSDKDSTSTNTEKNDDKKILKMATSADFPPFESRNPDGEFVGFDIELARMIAKELGYELVIEDMKFDGLVGALQANRVDMAMAGMSKDEKRKKNVDFSAVYNESSEMFLSKPDAPIEDLDSLTGKVVGVQIGSIQEEGAKKLSEEYDFEVKVIDDAGMMVQELNTGRIDAVYMDKDVALGFIEEQNLFGFDDPTTSSPGMAIAFPKGSELVKDVDEVIEKLEENGELQALKEKWLSKEE
jgi:polar amino acid transport system substrate-binding protein